MGKLSVLCSAGVLVSSSWFAQATAQPYVSGGAGAVFLGNTNYRKGNASGRLSFHPGYGLSAALGYVFGPGLRAELEFAVRENWVDDAEADRSGSFDQDGYITSAVQMINLYYDLNFGGRLVPFVLGGIGSAHFSADLNGRYCEDDYVFAYQAGAGGGFQLNPRLFVDVQYRWFRTDNPELNGLETRYRSHNLFAGLRHTFQ